MHFAGVSIEPGCPLIHKSIDPVADGDVKKREDGPSGHVKEMVLVRERETVMN